MGTTVEDYLAAVGANLPEASGLLARLADEDHEIRRVVRINEGLTRLLLWSWASGDLDTCGRVLAVMELALVATADRGPAPVYNSVAIGMVETVDRDLSRGELAEFVTIWPPILREIGSRYVLDEHEDWCCDSDDVARLPLGLRLRLAVRMPIRTAVGLAGRLIGPKRNSG